MAKVLKSIAQGWGCKGHDNNFAMGSTQRAYAFVTNLFCKLFLLIACIILVIFHIHMYIYFHPIWKKILIKNFKNKKIKK